MCKFYMLNRYVELEHFVYEINFICEISPNSTQAFHIRKFHRKLISHMKMAGSKTNSRNLLLSQICQISTKYESQIC